MANQRQRKNKKKSSFWMGNIIVSLFFLFFIIGICSPLLVAFWPMDSGHFLITDVWNYELLQHSTVGDLLMLPVYCLLLLILLAVLLIGGAALLCFLLGTPVGQIMLVVGVVNWLRKDD